MSRLFFHLIFLYCVASLHLRNFEYENHREQLKNMLITGAWKQGLEFADKFLQKNPESHYAWYCLGRFSFEAALNTDQSNYLKQSCNALEKAIAYNNKNPRYYYWKANIHHYMGRLYGNSKEYQKFLDSMQSACELDPMNYFYYSVFFEKTAGLFQDPRYLMRPILRQSLVNSMVNSLDQYLRLKKFYAKKYLIQLCTILTKNEKQKLSRKSDLHPDLLRALEMY